MQQPTPPPNPPLHFSMPILAPPPPPPAGGLARWLRPASAPAAWTSAGGPSPTTCTTRPSPSPPTTTTPPSSPPSPHPTGGGGRSELAGGRGLCVCVCMRTRGVRSLAPSLLVGKWLYVFFFARFASDCPFYYLLRATAVTLTTWTHTRCWGWSRRCRCAASGCTTHGSR